jgi:chemotaxis signal transduction protein
MPVAYATPQEAYGINILPWNDTIQLEALPPGTPASPLIKGSIKLSSGIAPIFDLRMQTMDGISKSKESCLLVVSMFNNNSGPMLVGLLIHMDDNGFSFPASLLNNIGGSKNFLAGLALN